MAKRLLVSKRMRSTNHTSI